MKAPGKQAVSQPVFSQLSPARSCQDDSWSLVNLCHQPPPPLLSRYPVFHLWLVDLAIWQTRSSSVKSPTIPRISFEITSFSLLREIIRDHQTFLQISFRITRFFSINKNTLTIFQDQEIRQDGFKRNFIAPREEVATSSGQLQRS